ncbi:MAG: PASTA domain-containing protein, partial [Candidatus Hydrogenedens sp.]|nr:PASTA domain-containing protein [Candidatus Hydrogenedens sp.]
MKKQTVLFPLIKSVVVLCLLIPSVLLTKDSYPVILISNVNELQNIGNDAGYPLDGEYELTQDIDASDTINWNDGAGFVPIGTKDNPFVGRFDGNGHKIHRLYINRSGQGNVGLFGYIGKGGEVLNLGIEEGWITGSGYTGILAGYSGGMVRNCYTTGVVSGDCDIGGLVGRNYYGTITQSYSTGVVSGGPWNIGGLVGYNGGGTITQSYSTGRVLGSGDDIGGLVGDNNGGTIMQSYWDKETSGQTTSSGGTGKTTAEMKQQATYVGWDFENVWTIEEGVRYPYLRALGPTQEPTVIEIDSLSELQLVGSGGWDYPPWGHYKLVADIDAWDTINWNSGAGFVPIGSNSPFVGKFDGNGHKIRRLYINRSEQDNVGLFGYIFRGGEVINLGIEEGWIQGKGSTGILAGYSLGVVRNCYTTGVVSGSGSVGGLVGINDYSGTITQSYSTGGVSGSRYIGGLVGRNYSGTITQSYSTGRVLGSEYIGGLVGYNDSGKITGSYWDKETSGQSSSAGAIGKTTAQMKHQATFVDWDFTTVWGIVENTTYPYLKWQYQVPDVVGLSQSSAESAITGAGLTVGTVTQQCSDTVPAGNVISQTPTAGTQVSPGTTVDLVVSTGLCPVNIPNVVGMSQSSAESAITGAGLTVGTVTQQCSDTVSAGNVISQNPPAETQVSPGAEINLVISTGPCPVNVPNVVGMSQSSAEDLIRGAGLTIGTVTQQCSDTVPVGNVISQNPSAGQQVNPGTSVDLVVSTGPCPVEVPNVVGMSQSSASSAITGAGLTVGTISQQCRNDVPAGDVISQTPTAGTQVSPGVEVNLVISTGPCAVNVPDVVGKPRGDAESTITGAGLTVGTVTQQCSDTVSAGNVISQSPTAEMQVDPGTTVELVVSTGNCPTPISSIEELQKIGNDPGYPLNGEYELTQDIDASETINWNDGAGFAPIGTEANPFVGRFDGNGHKITSLLINRTATNNVGLFSYIGNTGKIYDLQIDNSGVFGKGGIGALCGYNKGRVERCYVTGSTTIGGSNNVGSLVGNNDGTVTQSYSTGSVSGDWKVGGLVGLNGGTITQSYSTGSVSGSSSVGGLVGVNYSGVITQSYATGSVVGGDNIGGLVGENDGSGTVMQSYATGPVTGTGFYVGGLVGISYSGSIVTQSYATGLVSGNYGIGGLVGGNGGTVSQSYSTGSVSGGENVGGLVGLNWSAVEQSYWDKEASGQTTSGGGTGKTTAEMKQQVTYIGWNFITIWGIVENETYPYLKTVPQKTSVPSVIGISQSSAESSITGAGLTVGSITQKCSDTVSEGNVISQSPTAGTEVSPGMEVNLVVSTGPCAVTIPNVVGLLQSTAESLIISAGLYVGNVSQQCNNTVESGKVISQNPTGGTQTSIGSTVNLVVSTGPCPVTIPNVVGLVQSTAESLIISAGLYVGNVSQQCNNTVESGKVISQNPTGGTQTSIGSTVNLVVSTGPCSVTIPNVVGLVQSTAESLIISAGLYVGNV